MKQFLLVSLFFSFSSSYSSDSISPVNVSPSASSPEIETADAYRSSELRKNLKFQGTIDFIGREFIAAGTTTLSAGYYLDSNNILLVNYSTFNGEYLDKAAIKLRATSIGLRHFAGNSFNYTPTVYYRKHKADYYDEGNARIISGPNVIYEDVGLGIRVGNEWQYNYFTLGCDWFGINATVFKLHDEYNSAGEMKDENLTRGLTFNLFHFYVGLAF